MLTNGSSTTSCPSAFASRPITTPFCFASSRLQVAASPIVLVIPVDQTLVEIPGGPSTRRSEGIPSLDEAGPGAGAADAARCRLRATVDQRDLLLERHLGEQLVHARVSRHRRAAARLREEDRDEDQDEAGGDGRSPAGRARQPPHYVVLKHRISF